MANDDAKGRVTYSGSWTLEGTKGVSLKVITTIELLVTLSGMTQAELAESMGIHEGTLSEYLSGKRPVGPTGIRQFAKALKVSPEVLARGEGLSLQDVRDDVVERLEKQAKADKLAEPPTTTTYAGTSVHLPANVFPLDRRLKPIESIEQAPDLEPIPIWPEGIAASDLESNDAIHDAEKAWVASARIQGAGAFAVRIVGRSMIKAGIEPGDILIVRSSTSAKENDIVIATQDGGVTCKRKSGDTLVAESDEHKSIRLSDDNRVLAVARFIYKPPKK